MDAFTVGTIVGVTAGAILYYLFIGVIGAIGIWAIVEAALAFRKWRKSKS